MRSDQRDRLIGMRHTARERQGPAFAVHLTASVPGQSTAPLEDSVMRTLVLYVVSFLKIYAV
jgi:hypothetical protein